MQILMVDDDDGDIILAQAAIRSMGITLEPVPDGATLLQLLADGVRPDLILLDINMPGLDGVETLQRVRADPKTGHLRIVMLTTSGADRDVHRAKDAGADGYIQKPLRPDNLAPILVGLR